MARRGTGSFSSAGSSVRPTGTRCGSRRWARFAVGRWLWSGSGRKGSVEAIRDYIPQPPGCRQGTSLAPVAWHNCPAAKRGGPSVGPEDFWIDDATPWSWRGLGATARRGARMRARAHTARTLRSRQARHDHDVHASVTARTPRCTARTPRSRRARFGHGAHASVTECTSRSMCARRGTAGTVGTASPAA